MREDAGGMSVNAVDTDSPGRLQAGPAGSPATRWTWLGRCLGNPERFIARDWLARPSLDRGVPSRFTGILSVEELDHTLAMGVIASTQIRMVSDGVLMPPAAFISAPGSGVGGDTTIDCGRIGELIRQGGTLAITRIDAVTPRLFELCGGLERELSHRVYASAYLTPPRSQGFRAHRDAHDTLILQVSGRKEWLVYDFRPGGGNTPESVDIEPAETAVLHAVLEPGDALYIPRGWPHLAKTSGTASLHVTLAIAHATARDLMLYALEVPEVRRRLGLDLPAGFADDPAALGPVLAEGYRRLEQALADPVIERAVTEGFARSWRQGRARAS
jgi:bifunctional lysine-specific demethylase and histidyl-hydroxylase NO66